MRVTIEIDENLSEECVVIKCKELNEHVMKLQKTLMEQTKSDMTIFHNKEYYGIKHCGICRFSQKVYVSRNYYKALIERLAEKRRKI